MRHTEPGIFVEIPREGLRRAREDNTLLRSTRTRNAVIVWAATVSIGIFMGWMAAKGLAQ